MHVCSLCGGGGSRTRTDDEMRGSGAMRRGRGVREEDETYEGCSCLALRSCNASAKAKPGSEERGCESERVRE